MEIIYQAESDIERRLKQLRTYTSTPGNGVTRLPFSEEAKQAVAYLKGEMESAGLKTSVDLVGNVRGVLPADTADARTIIMGSHYDTVKSGGEYDGIAGVVCAISVAELLRQSGIRRKYNLEIIAFNDEEGMMFGSGCLGSKSLTGQVDRQYIEHLTDENGISIKEWMLRWGSDPEKIDTLKLDMEKVKAFFEVHIEQGPVLDEKKYELGIVTGIVGLLRCMATIEGRADHAGTTPMYMRQDTINIASKVISRLDELADREQNGTVATCGFVRAYPNAMNVIASKTEFTMDIRSISDASIDHVQEEVWELLEEHTGKCGASYDVDIKLRQPAVRMSAELVDRLSEKCREHGYSYLEMVSGAAHDAMVFADKVDTVMVFVPSLNGRSHCPEEYSSYGDLARAVQVILDVMTDMMSE